MPRDDTVGRSELELLRSQTARAADGPLLDKVNALVTYLRSERETNHWVARSREAFRNEHDGR